MPPYVDPKLARLDALAEVLKAHRLSAESILGGLVVQDAQAKVVVTCRPHSGDDRRLWFFAEPDRAPLAEADQLTNALVAIKGRLAAKPS